MFYLCPSTHVTDRCYVQLRPEKAIEKVDREEALRSFEINTLGHLLTYKHFVPLLPAKKVEGKQDNEMGGSYLQPGLNVLASMSARVGSIGDNKGELHRLRSQ